MRRLPLAAALALATTATGALTATAALAAMAAASIAPQAARADEAEAPPSVAPPCPYARPSAASGTAMDPSSGRDAREAEAAMSEATEAMSAAQTGREPAESPSITDDRVRTSQAAPDNRPVTQEQYKELVRVFKHVVDRFDKIEKKMASGGGKDEAVDLNALNVAGAGEAPLQASNTSGTHSKVGSTAVPDFKIYFDINLINRPGIEDLSFDSYHQFLFFEILPTPDIQFSFDVNPTPKFFELDYQLTQRLQLRAGRIWIPFDDMAPHNIFGGRVNVSRLAIPGNPAFLPDLWTDMGVGLKYQLADTPKFSADSHLYMVNGFQDGGKDPKGGPVYPSFSDVPYRDNNRDKAIGGRLHMLIAGKVGLGASFYTEKWTSDSASVSERMLLLGFDGQLRFGDTELRTGLMSGTIGLPTGDAARGGLYGEIGQKFGGKKDWKLLFRGGLVQFDDRITVNATDQTIVGATLLWKPGLLQYSVEYSQDLKQVAAKSNYSYTALRLVCAF